MMVPTMKTQARWAVLLLAFVLALLLVTAKILQILVFLLEGRLQFRHDLVVVMTLVSQEWDDDGRAVAVFGKRGQMLAEALSQARAES